MESYFQATLQNCCNGSYSELNKENKYSKMFLTYFKSMKDESQELPEKQREEILISIQNNILKRLHFKIFPTESSKYDAILFDKLHCLQGFITPQMLEVKNSSLSIDSSMWEIPLRSHILNRA